MFECKSCNSMKMTLDQSIEHILTFCALNFRSKCIFCEKIAPQCSCTKHRQSLKSLVRKRLSCEIFDLHNHRHRLLAHLYCIYRKFCRENCRVKTFSWTPISDNNSNCDRGKLSIITHCWARLRWSLISNPHKLHFRRPKRNKYRGWGLIQILWRCKERKHKFANFFNTWDI